MPYYTFQYRVDGKAEKKRVRAIDEGSAEMKAEEFIEKLKKKKPTSRIIKGFMYED